MAQDDALRVLFSEDGKLGVVFSDEFLASSVEEQMEALKALLREKQMAPFYAEDVSQAAAENEIMIILIEVFLGKLRRGERIEKDTSVGMSLQDLEMPFNTWD
jgi:hypothetical protein